MMTEETLKKLKKQVCESLATDRHALLMKFPFAGNILMRMDLVPIRDKRVRTACTDGKKIYFDIDFYTRLKDSERVFVMAHECFHCVLMHLVRCQTRDQRLFNIASDMEVNYMLSNQSNGHDIQPPPEVLFPPANLQGESAEVIYEWLLKSQKKNKSNSQAKSQGSQSQSGNRGDEETSYEDNVSARGGNRRSDPNSGKDGNSTGKLEGQFDSHTYGGDPEDSSNGNPQENGSETGSSRVKDQWGDVGYDEDFKPKIDSDFAEKMREAVIAEVQRCEQTKGDVPSGLDGIIKEMLKPEISWKDVLSQFVTTCFGGKRKWLPPSRRHVYDEIYLQSRRDEKIKVGCLVDTSGSCWGDLSKFFGELSGLLNSFGNYDLFVIQCDAAVHGCDQYDAGNPFPVDDPSSIDIKGCGGSDFRPAFKYIRENALEFDALVCFTDGYIDVPTYDPGYPVLWVLTKDGNENLCDWGQKLKFKNASYEESSRF